MSLDLEREVARRRAGVADLMRELDRQAVPAARVPITTRVAAETALDAACRELGIVRPRLAWLPPALVAGICDGVTPRGQGDVVYLSAGLDPARAAHAARHEARHCWQHATSRFLEPQVREQDAEWFAHRGG